MKLFKIILLICFGTIFSCSNTEIKKNVSQTPLLNSMLERVEPTNWWVGFKESSLQLLVKENKFVWKWKLENKTKKIGSFLCNKATIKFRGRNYTAWYTLAIPVPFGPWKFKNLPGLILEVYDTNKEFHIFSNKVRINKKNCNIVFDKNQLKKAMNLKTYLKKKDSLLDNYFAMMSAKIPKGTKHLKPANASYVRKPWHCNGSNFEASPAGNVKLRQTKKLQSKRRSLNTEQ